MRCSLVQNNKKSLSILRILLIVILLTSLLTPGIYGTDYLTRVNGWSEKKIVTQISKQIEIPANSDYYLKFYSNNLTLEEQEVEPISSGLSEKVQSAIAKSPNWIQRRLTRQFLSIDNPEDYADLILNVSKQYADEIAFSIACSPLGNLPEVDVIDDNVRVLYELDKQIQYADIIDYDDGAGNYYSTIRYNVTENETEKQLEYPKDIYYWYCVHPQLSKNDAEYVYGKVWREYLFYHNDLGYPLLNEKLSNLEYMWDCESYYQPANRLWKWSMENHPTAIEAISYWIGKTVPAQAIGDRPSQPNIIAHEHNGWCGELQRIAVAALRTALIPSVGASNVGEDHVWREFYERGWHQNDNWWTDGGGTVDTPDVYAYGWKKNMSAIYAWKGDSSIYDVTSRYIHPEDRITARFVVLDSYLKPIDGARVTVVVEGPKDITWLKYKILEKIEEVWDKLPDFVKGKILQDIYLKIQKRIEEIPDSIDGLTITTWNYTDLNGQCSFELGKNREYLFIIQQGNLRKPWQLAKNNAIRLLRNPEDKTFNVFFPDLSHRVLRHKNNEMPEGDCTFDISFNTTAYQLQPNVRSDNIGNYEFNGKIDFFIVDEENFENYKNGERFNCYNYIEDEKVDISINTLQEDWYIVFRNHARRTNIILDFSIQVKVATDQEKIQIVTPNTDIFENPIFNVGDTINISGVATDDILLKINGETIDISTVNYRWFYEWDTLGKTPGEYLTTAYCGDAQDELLIELIDVIPPSIGIEDPENGAIVEGEFIEIVGNSNDNTGVERIEVAIDDSEFIEASGTETWFIEWNISELELGDHNILARALDAFGGESIHSISFVVNESGHEWGPQINDLYHTPENPTNVSNVVIYANVTESSPFAIKKVVLFCDNGIEIMEHKMYRYGDNPVQSRHEEDPLKNQSNDPIFGVELGQFSTGEIISYWIIAYDTANNSRKSDIQSFNVN